MKWKTEDGGWSPYRAGALVGLLAIASVYATNTRANRTVYFSPLLLFVRQ